MRFQIWALSAVSLLVDTVSGTAISFQPRGWRTTQDVGSHLRRAALAYEGDIGTRSVSTTSLPAAASVNSTVNTTQVATACMSALSSMTSVSNTAGFAGCYNVLAWDPSRLTFEADLRIYQEAPATGAFANVTANQITVMLKFPEGTEYSALVKRNVVQLHQRDGSIVQSQQFSLAGTLRQQTGTLNLNQTLLASLMVPQISLQATSSTSQNIITTNMTASDSAWFVAGQFSDISQQASQVANPATASAALAASKGFVLPGQTFGIFPTGLIVTSLWTIVFFVAFGLGTIGRIRSRDLYRTTEHVTDFNAKHFK